MLSTLFSAHGIFVAVALPAIFIFATITPPAWGLDEQVHTARAYDISKGNLYPKALKGEYKYGGELPVALIDVLNHGHFESNTVDRTKVPYARQDIRYPQINEKLQDAVINEGNARFYDYGPAGIYTPVLYAPASAGIYVGRVLDLPIGATINLGRLVQGIFYMTICAISIYFVRAIRVKWLIFILALLPTSIFQAIIISADAATTAICLLFFALISRLWLSSKHGGFGIALPLLVGSLLALTKPSYILLLGLVWFLPKNAIQFRYGSISAKVLLTLLPVSLFAFVTLLGKRFADSMAMYFPRDTFLTIEPIAQLKSLLLSPVDFLAVLSKTVVYNFEGWLQGSIGILGYNGVPTPYPMVVLVCISLLLSAIWAAPAFRKSAWLFLLFGSVSSLAVIVLLYMTFNPVGSDIISGVQGRYFIPLLPFLLLGLAKLIPFTLNASRKFTPLYFVAVSALTLYGSVISYGLALY